MTTEQDVLYVPQLAAKMGRTESSIRSAVTRGADWLPPRLQLGARLAWRRATVDAFLKAREQKAARQHLVED
jgi:predicted DNA-binding transcriptional regulator AlpA